MPLSSEQTHAVATRVGLFVTGLAEELTVGQLLASAGTYQLLVVEFGTARLARTVVLARVTRALADPPAAQLRFLLDGLRKSQCPRSPNSVISQLHNFATNW